ncbi:MAG: hypothetical protein B1H07_00535 [Campylobacteraceae bacterium 4484_166]|nr:MAG: hypothetical protein B1H07_00535 [Campylobacteraceae bacterium 4484_166]
MLYGKCQGCHGAKGEKVALGKSKIINKMSAKEFEDAILGYQKQTYGGAMKELMQGQVLNMKPNEIKAIAAYITKK